MKNYELWNLQGCFFSECKAEDFDSALEKFTEDFTGEFKVICNEDCESTIVNLPA